jgi:triosephosphate isomerase
MMTPIIAGNWKMNTVAREAQRLASSIRTAVETNGYSDRCTVILCPPFVNLSIVGECIRGSSIALGGQNCWAEPYGAYTGEVSAAMLRAVGCRYVIIGHSERRTIFREDDALIVQKLLRAWEEELIPIVCVGETLHERQLDRTWSVLETQLAQILELEQRRYHWICAYEPVWAIGTGIAAEPEQIEAAHGFLRAMLDAHACSHVPILYGGSITDANAALLFSVQYVSGGLVGGASLNAERFVRIIAASINAHSTKG